MPASSQPRRARSPLSTRERAARDGLLPAMLDGARRGDEFAFQVLYEWSIESVAAYATLRLSASTRHVVLREVYQSAWERIPRFHDEAPAAFELWLVRLLEEHRAERGHQRDEGGDAIEALPAALREALALRDIFGRSVEQTALALAVRPEQVRLWHREALAGVAVAA